MTFLFLHTRQTQISTEILIMYYTWLSLKSGVNTFETLEALGYEPIFSQDAFSRPSPNSISFRRLVYKSVD